MQKDSFDIRRRRLSGSGNKKGLLFVSAFLCAFLGTLVWVNGRGAWFVVRFAKLPSFAPALSLAYTLWLVCYVLFGAALFLSIKIGRKWGKCVFADSAILLLSYFFSLLWYPFFYSAHFLLLSLLTLCLASAATVIFCLRIIRKAPPLALMILPILLNQGFFIAVTMCSF